MGDAMSKSSNLVLSATYGSMNLVKSAIELASQSKLDLTNPSPHSTSALAFASLLVYGADGDDFPGYNVVNKLQYRRRHIDLHAWFITQLHSKQAILAVRGTASASNLWSDMLLMHHTVEEETVHVLRDFVRLLKGDYQVTCTGHSLGGFWASALSVEEGFACVTFSSPRNLCGFNFHAAGDSILNADPMAPVQCHDVVLPLNTHSIRDIATFIIEREEHAPRGLSDSTPSLRRNSARWEDCTRRC